jgi:short-subunit dehydrogenase
MNHLKDQVTLITGAAGGIGSAAARLFARLGARLVVTAREASQLDAIDLGPGEAALRALRLPLDVTDPAAWEQVVQRALQEHGRLDILVNNAGVVEPGYAHELLPEVIERQVTVNLLGTLYGCRAALRIMRRQGRGRIVNLGSLAGIVPTPGEAVYSATKHGIRGYTFSLHGELRGTGVGVCVVCPDSVETKQLQHELQHDMATMSFVDAPLSPEKVATAIVAATRTRKPEILVPAGMGLLSRIAMAFPRLVFLVLPFLQRAGARRMAERRRGRGPAGGP